MSIVDSLVAAIVAPLDVNAVMDGDLDGFIKAYLMEFAGNDAE